MFYKKYNRFLQDQISGYLFIAPFFIIFVLFGLFPILFTAYMSLFQWDIMGSNEFIGFDNYITLLNDNLFWTSIYNTFSIWFLTIVPQLFLSIVLAVLLNQAFLKWKSLIRVVILIPNITSVVAVAIIFTAIFSTRYGLLNYLISIVGIDPINWKASSLGTHTVVAFMITWRWTGYGAMLFLAGLQSIPSHLYEAAKIDGANVVKQFFTITIPMLRPLIIFKLTLMTVNGMQIFAEPLIFAGPGGGGSAFGLTASLLMYEEAFVWFSFGYASSIAWVLFIIIVLFSLLNIYLTRKLKSGD